VSKQGVVPCGWFLNEPRCLGVPALWSFEARRQRQRLSDLVWSGVDDLVRGMWRSHPLWRSSLVEIGIKVTVVLIMEET